MAGSYCSCYVTTAIIESDLGKYDIVREKKKWIVDRFVGRKLSEWGGENWTFSKYSNERKEKKVEIHTWYRREKKR